MKLSLSKFLSETVTAAGEILLKYYHRTHQVEIKGDRSIVTEADKRSEQFIVKNIFRNFPQSSIITEESGEYEGNRSLCWVIDPLDGTTNYAHGFPWFCVSVGVYEGDKPRAGAVYNPLSRELFLAEVGRGCRLNGKRVRVSQVSRMKSSLVGSGIYYSSRGSTLRKDMDIFRRVNERVLGLRRPGAAALDLANVACGRFDGYWQRGLSCWDVAAAYILISEAGGKVTNFQGKKTNIFEREVIASNKKLHRGLVSLIRQKR